MARGGGSRCGLATSGLTAQKWRMIEDDSAASQKLLAAEGRALALLDAIEVAGLIAPGRTELEIERGIFAIAARDFGVTDHWHDRVVRAGLNTLLVAGEGGPDRMIAEDDIVFLDLGPVFGEWEADVGRSYAVGSDPDKHRLCADLLIIFDSVKAHFKATQDITGAGLYAFAESEAERHGWRFGGRIAGHLVGPFPYAMGPGISPADKELRRVSPRNPTPMRGVDAAGRARHWILEIHLVSPDRQFGGFYERLLEGPANA